MKRSPERPTRPRRSARVGARRARSVAARRGAAAAAAAAARRGGGAGASARSDRGRRRGGTQPAWTRKFGGSGIRRKSCVLKQKARLRRRRRRHAAAASSSVLPSRPPPRRAAAPTYLGDGHRLVDESSPAKFNAALGDALPFVAGVTPGPHAADARARAVGGRISPSQPSRIGRSARRAPRGDHRRNADSRSRRCSSSRTS